MFDIRPSLCVTATGHVVTAVIDVARYRGWGVA